MSEPTPDAPDTPDAPADGDQGAPEPAAEVGDAGKQAIDRMKAERNAARREAADAKRQLDELNRANESVVEKAQREAREAQENAATATIQAFRDAAVEFGGISQADAELFLTASDAETLRKQIAGLVAKRADSDTNTPAGPRPDLSQGGKGKPAAGTPEQDFANFMGQALAQ